MKKVVLILGFICTLNLYAGNLGDVEYPWNVTSMSDRSWKKVVVFKIKKKRKVYRALADIDHVLKSEYEFKKYYKMGAIKKCIIIAIKDVDKSIIYSKLASATDYGDIYDIFGRKYWNYNPKGGEIYDHRSSNLNQCK